MKTDGSPRPVSAFVQAHLNSQRAEISGYANNPNVLGYMFDSLVELYDGLGADVAKDQKASPSDDYYFDSALLKGTITGTAMPLERLFLFAATRGIVRMQAQLTPAEIADDKSGTNRQKKSK